MGHNLAYYIFVLIAVVVGFFVVKKVASCLIKTLILMLIVGALLFVYFNYFQ
ncbi:MAG: sulfate transporter [Prevotella sp.]